MCVFVLTSIFLFFVLYFQHFLFTLTLDTIHVHSSFLILNEELFNVKHSLSSVKSPASVVNVFIRNLEFRLVARQLLFIHMAKFSRMRTVPFSGLL